MTTNSDREVFPGERQSHRGLSPALTIRVVQIVLWLLVMAGPITALVVATQLSSLRERLDVADRGTGVALPPDTTGAEGFAELFIASYLGAGEDSSNGLDLFVGGVSLDGVEDGSWSVARTTSLGAEQVGPGYYAVTVAAEVLAAGQELDGPSVWVPVGTRFYSVGVLETATGWVIAGLPTLVPSPLRANSPELLIRHFDGLDAAPGLAEMLSRFLAAFLAGDGELTRYTSPSSQIVAVQPPAFVTVEIVRAGLVESLNGLSEVAAVVLATDEADRAQVLEYSLVVEQRDGRWEVSQLLPAPPLAP